jgi:hypothetical protein
LVIKILIDVTPKNVLAMQQKYCAVQNINIMVTKTVKINNF